LLTDNVNLVQNSKRRKGMASNLQQRLLAGVITFFCLTAGLFGQVERGTISGTVTDNSGASVVGVEITVSNPATGFEFKTVTSSEGQFVAPNLIAGTYKVVAAHPGFKTINRGDLIVRPSQRSSIDLVLEVGEVTQTVEVTGELAPLLAKESATVSTVIEARQVTELPTIDRTMFNLAPLMAGVTVANTQANSINIPDNARVAMGINANGLGASAINNFTLDGVNNTQVSGTSSYQGVLPPIEAIQEFTIDSSNSLAELGRGGTNIRVTLKSGTNNLHGSIFQFHRNAALNARNFFDRKSPGSDREKPNYIQNQFGGVLGGPIIKNKTFFFADYQGVRQREGRTWVSTTPSAPVRAGDFSGTSQIIYDPATWDAATGTRQPFPGNIIPAGRINPVALKILTYSPLPNGTVNSLGQGIVNSSSVIRRTQDSFDAKIDHQLSGNDFIGGRFSWGRSFARIPGAWTDLPGLFPIAQGGALQQAGASQYLPGTVSNPGANLGLQWIHNFSPTTINEARISWMRAGADAQVLGHGNKYGDQIGIPNANVDDINTGFPTQSITGMSQMGEAGAYPLISIENAYQVLDNVTMVRGSHTFKFGTDLRLLRQTFIQLLGGNAGGSFSYNQFMTGDPRNPNATGNAMASFLLGIPASGALKRVSGTAGMRWKEASWYAQDTWKMTPKLTWTYGVRYELFTPEFEVADRMSNFDYRSGTLVVPSQGGSDPALSTRALVAMNKKNIQPRLGLAYQLTPKTVLRSGFAIVSGMGMSKAFGFMSGNAPFAGGTNYFNADNPQQILRTIDQGFSATQPFLPTTNPGPLVWAADPQGPGGYTQQWSLGIQRELASNLALEVNYVGHTAMHLQNLPNINGARPGTGAAPVRTPYFQTLPNAPAINYWTWRDKASYQSLQGTLTKRFSAGLAFQAAYTWSHNIGTINAAYRTINVDYLKASALDQTVANTGINAPQRFVANWNWELPIGRGKAHAQNISPVLDAFIGGWRFSGVLAFQSGSPFSVGGGTGAPNRICDGQTPPGGHTVQRWFDTSCFVIPATVTDPVRGGQYTPWGNAGLNILRGDGIRQNDLSLTKFFNIGGEGRQLQFRAEFLNALNNPQFLLPLSNIQAGNAGLVTVANPARNIQFALKYTF
jgi:Carboxypeptidase regulatory-like domain